MQENKTNTKILVLTGDFPPAVGGIQTIISEIFRFFNAGNTIIIAPYNPKAKAFDSQYGPRIIRYKFLSPELYFSNRLLKVLKKSLIYFIMGFFSMSRIIEGYLLRCEKEQLILVCGNIAIAPLAYAIKKVFGLDFLVFVYAMEILCLPRERLRRMIIGAMLRNARNIITISDFTVGEICKFGVKRKKIVKIPLGHHIEWESQNSAKEARIAKHESFKILTIARLVERKGHDMVLRAISLLKDEGYKIGYTIVGDGPMMEKLKALCVELDIGEAVEFVGVIPYSEAPKFYEDCDLFIMPSRYIQNKKDVEGFGVVFLEANYFGKPVIGGNSGGIPDAIKDGLTGFLVNPEDPVDIATKIKKLIDNPRLARKLGEQGRKRVHDEFTWERAASIIERVMLQHQVKSEK